MPKPCLARTAFSEPAKLLSSQAQSAQAQISPHQPCLARTAFSEPTQAQMNPHKSCIARTSPVQPAHARPVRSSSDIYLQSDSDSDVSSLSRRAVLFLVASLVSTALLAVVVQLPSDAAVHAWPQQAPPEDKKAATTLVVYHKYQTRPPFRRSNPWKDGSRRLLLQRTADRRRHQMTTEAFFFDPGSVFTYCTLNREGYCGAHTHARSQ